MEIFADPAFWVALGAFLISGLVGLGLLGLRRRQFNLEERIGELQIEEWERRAAARTRAKVRLRATRDRLLVQNLGGGVATDVTVELECPDGTSPFPANLDVFPIDLIDPGDEVPVATGFHMGCFPPLPAVVRWNDPDGDEGEEEVTVRTL